MGLDLDMDLDHVIGLDQVVCLMMLYDPYGVVAHPRLLLEALWGAGIWAEGLQVHAHLLGAQRRHLFEDRDELLDAEGLDRLPDELFEKDLVDDRDVLEQALFQKK